MQAHNQGVIKAHSIEDNPIVRYLPRTGIPNGCDGASVLCFAGNFGWSYQGNHHTGILVAALEPFNIPLTADEVVYRYHTYNTDLGGLAPLIKFNVVTGKVYFLDLDAANDGLTIKWLRPIKLDYLTLIIGGW